MAERGTVYERVAEASKQYSRSRTHDRESRNRLWTLALDARTFFSMARDWMRGGYRNVSGKTIALTIAAVLYFISPIDLIPDWIPGLGQIDDVLVLGLVLSSMHSELQNYRLWREMQHEQRP
jgi:uncharacterized membrane protein YkvA (DUF1232 family)